MGSRVQLFIQHGGVMAAFLSSTLLLGCGDGGGTTVSAAPAAETAVIQSDIVLPSSVQVVTAK